MAKRKWGTEEIRRYRETHGKLIYYNSDDANIFVPKFYGIGFTANWAHPATRAVVAGILLLGLAINLFAEQ